MPPPSFLKLVRPSRPPRSRSRLRRSLGACTAEGIAAEVTGAFSGGLVLTGWALHLGFGPQLVGMLGALPFAAHLFQLPGAWLTSRFGSRRVALVTVAISRQLFLPLALLPWLPIGGGAARALLLGIAFSHHALSIVCNNAWTAWVGEMVPARMRGRYFGRRTAICTLAQGAAALSAGLALDRGAGSGRAEYVLAALALLACAAGAASTMLMARQHSRPPRRERTAFAMRATVAPARDRRGRRMLTFAFAWSAAVGLAGPFFTIYLLVELRAGYAAGALYAAGLAAARIASAPLWGRVIDRLGPRAVLLTCSLGLALSPAVWLLASPDRLWPIALDAVLGGALFAGHALAMFSLPLAIAPDRERPFWGAAFAVAGGTGYGLASALTGVLAEHSGATWLGTPMRLAFAASAVCRIGGAGLAALVEDDPAPAAKAPAVVGEVTVPALRRAS